MVSLDDILEAQARIRGIAVHTPLIETRIHQFGSTKDARRLYLKAENLQPIGAFKLRGAYNKIASLSEEERRRGIITYSSGNHAQGVAYAARALGAKAVITMPSTAPKIKLEATAALGAEIILAGTTGLERQIKAEELAALHGYVIVPPFNDDKIIAGQGTVGLEILEDLPEVETVLVPIGGGGLISGVATALKLSKPEVRVIGVEPALGADAQASLRAGKIVEFPAGQVTQTIADGLRAQYVGEINFELIRRYVDDIVTVSEDEIREATRRLAENPKTVAEPSGAVAAAAFLFHQDLLPKTKINVAVISGGNIDPQMLADIRARQALESDCMMTMRMTIRRIASILIFVCLGGITGFALGDRGSPVTEAMLYISPDASSSKLVRAGRGRELIVLESTNKWLHVEALLSDPRPEIEYAVNADEDEGKTVTGWIMKRDVVLSTTPDGDKILFGEAVDSEDQASQAHGRVGAAQDAQRLYYRVADLFPASPLAAEALYRSADIRWQVARADILSKPSAREQEAYLRGEIDDHWMKEVIKKYPGTKWADMAAFHLIDNKLCGNWQGAAKCPIKEAEIYEKYAAEHPESPNGPEALYDAAWRWAALIEIYKSEGEQKKSDDAKAKAISLAQKAAAQFTRSDWGSRAHKLLYLLQQGIPAYGNAED